MGRIYITSSCERCGGKYEHQKSRKQRFCSSECCARARWQSGCASPTEAFWTRVDKNGPISSHMPHLGQCWIWTAGRFQEGYGKIRWNGRVAHAHRVSWVMANGPIPDDTPCVLHHCDNPSCVRPDHLWLGTRTDNNADMYAKGRANPWGHKAALGLVLVLALVAPASAQQSSPAVTDWSRIECKDERSREQKIKDGCIVEYQGGLWMECAVAHGCRVLPPLVTHSFIQPDLNASREPQASAATVKESLTTRSAVKPKDERFNWTFALGSAGYWGSFAADITTTKGSLDRGSIERNRLFGRDNGHKVLYAANAIATAGIYGIAVYLERKGHRRAARVLLFTGTVIRTSAAIWNHNRRR